MAGKEEYTVEEMHNALIECKGAVVAAADFLGCSYTTVYNYIDRYPELKNTLKEQRRLIGGLAKTVLADGVIAGDRASAQFWLNTQGDDEGHRWAKRGEVTGKDGGPQEHKTTVTDERTEQARAEIDKILAEASAQARAKVEEN
jgi:hypothetical protein